MDQGQHFTNCLGPTNSGNRVLPTSHMSSDCTGSKKGVSCSCSVCTAQTACVWSFPCSAVTLPLAVVSLPFLSPLLFSEASDYLLMLDLASTHCLWEPRKGNVLALSSRIYNTTLKELCIYIFINHLSQIIFIVYSVLLWPGGGKALHL